MSASKRHKTPDFGALAEESEKVAGVLSHRPTAFQLEQAVNFNVVTVPRALRMAADLEEQLEAAERVARAADNPAVFDIADDRALYAAHKELAAALDAWRGDSSPASRPEAS